MRKIGILFCITIMILSISKAGAVSQSNTLAVPPLPAEDPNELKQAIAIVKAPATEQELREIASYVPGIKLRRIYTEAITGFSMEATAHAIERLQKHPGIETIS